MPSQGRLSHGPPFLQPRMFQNIDRWRQNCIKGEDDFSQVFSPTAMPNAKSVKSCLSKSISSNAAHGPPAISKTAPTPAKVITAQPAKRARTELSLLHPARRRLWRRSDWVWRAPKLFFDSRTFCLSLDYAPSLPTPSLSVRNTLCVRKYTFV